MTGRVRWLLGCAVLVVGVAAHAQSAADENQLSAPWDRQKAVAEIKCCGTSKNEPMPIVRRL